MPKHTKKENSAKERKELEKIEVKSGSFLKGLDESVKFDASEGEQSSNEDQDKAVEKSTVVPQKEEVHKESKKESEKTGSTTKGAKEKSSKSDSSDLTEIDADIDVDKLTTPLDLKTGISRLFNLPVFEGSVYTPESWKNLVFLYNRYCRMLGATDIVVYKALALAESAPHDGITKDFVEAMMEPGLALFDYLNDQISLTEEKVLFIDTIVIAMGRDEVTKAWKKVWNEGFSGVFSEVLLEIIASTDDLATVPLGTVHLGFRDWLYEKIPTKIGVSRSTLEKHEQSFNENMNENLAPASSKTEKKRGSKATTDETGSNEGESKNEVRKSENNLSIDLIYSSHTIVPQRSDATTSGFFAKLASGKGAKNSEESAKRLNQDTDFNTISDAHLIILFDAVKTMPIKNSEFETKTKGNIKRSEDAIKANGGDPSTSEQLKSYKARVEKVRTVLALYFWKNANDSDLNWSNFCRQERVKKTADEIVEKLKYLDTSYGSYLFSNVIFTCESFGDMQPLIKNRVFLLIGSICGILKRFNGKMDVERSSGKVTHLVEPMAKREIPKLKNHMDNWSTLTEGEVILFGSQACNPLKLIQCYDVRQNRKIRPDKYKANIIEITKLMTKVILIGKRIVREKEVIEAEDFSIVRIKGREAPFLDEFWKYQRISHNFVRTWRSKNFGTRRSGANTKALEWDMTDDFNEELKAAALMATEEYAKEVRAALSTKD